MPTAPARRRFVIIGPALAVVAVLVLALVPAAGADDGAPALLDEGEPGVPVDRAGSAETNGVTAFGAARDFGPEGGLDLAGPVVGMAATPTGAGYWTVARDGGVFSFGDAAFHGSTGGIRLNEPVVGMAATPTGRGYWLVARDGGVFSFGDASFHGSTGAIALRQPIRGMASTTDGRGYWLVGGDGGVFAFGRAPFYGSLGNRDADGVVAIAAAPAVTGYWIAARDGQVSEFGPPDHGSIDGYASDPELAPTVAMAADPRGGGYWLAHGVRAPLERAAEGPAVAGLQERLRALRYWVGPIDGVFGELTQHGVYAFQKYEGLPVTGEVDARTRSALDRAVPPRARTTSGDVLEVDKTRQIVFVVRGGATEWVFHTSTGAEEVYYHEGERRFSSTPNGRYDVFREIDGLRVAPLGRLYRPKYFTTNGIALHGYTSVPTQPASAGCVRVSNAAMDFVWDRDLVPIGTDVWVYGQNPG